MLHLFENGHDCVSAHSPGDAIEVMQEICSGMYVPDYNESWHQIDDREKININIFGKLLYRTARQWADRTGRDWLCQWVPFSVIKNPQKSTPILATNQSIADMVRHA